MDFRSTKLPDILNDLKVNYGAIALKCELGIEQEIAFLKELANLSNLDLTVKIGGCESVRDMYISKDFGANSIVAPMIESEYAMKKYIKSAKEIFNDEKLYINIETIKGVENIDEIISSQYFEDISGIVFGRSDFSRSMNLSCKDADSDVILLYAQKVSQKAQEFEKEFIVGGNISCNSVGFLKQIQYLNKFETRKIIFSASALQSQNIIQGILKAIEFEIEWIKIKSELYGKPSCEDVKRLELLKSRCML